MIALLLALAQDLTILVAEKDTPALANAEKLADGSAVFAERKLHKALSQAAELLKANPKATVNVKLAHGEYAGKGGKDGFVFEEVIAPEGTLRLLGGYDDDFKTRAPFDTPSILRVGAIALQFEGKKHALKELYISGLMTDVADTNAYDAKSNSLLIGSSSTNAIVTFGYLETQRLVIADCLFMNSSKHAASPMIRAMTPDAEVVIRNNFILNNRHAWVATSASFKHLPKQYVFEGNSFIMNWPYNPDPTTGNPAALEIGNKYTAAKIVIKDNLFAHNFGGAIYFTQDEKNGAPAEIHSNLFFDNGYLFGLDDPKMGAVVGKFGAFMSNKIPWNVLDIETVEDDYEWSAKGNVVMDPKVPVTLAKPGVADSGSIEAEKTVINDVRSLLGKNLQGGTLKVSDFAPRMAIDPAKLPFPAEPKAEKYGVRRDRVEPF